MVGAIVCAGNAVLATQLPSALMSSSLADAGNRSAAQIASHWLVNSDSSCSLLDAGLPGCMGPVTSLPPQLRPGRSAADSAVGARPMLRVASREAPHGTDF